MKRNPVITLIISISVLISACFLYEERDYNNPYDPALTGGANPIPYATIQLDGDTSEWASITTFISDQINEGTSSGQPSIPGGDIDTVKIAQDDENLYFLLITANGRPLETEGINFHMNLNDENNKNIQPLNISHNTDGTFGYWSNYNYYIGNDTWDGYELMNPAIRFLGLDSTSSSIEFGVSKKVYWDLLEINNKLKFEIDTWYEPYNTNDGDGGLDWLEDDYYLLIKGVDEIAPSDDVPIVQFGRPSSPLIIDGGSGDMGIWNETGYWFQDFLNDDIGTENNCDIDKIYMKQDDENIYVLMTFNDPAPYDGSTYPVSYNINVSQSEGTNSHTFHVDHDGSVTWVANINANPLNCVAISAEDGYLEMQFDKTESWTTLPYGSFHFFISAYDSGGTPVDGVSFRGSYKAMNDPEPSP